MTTLAGAQALWKVHPGSSHLHLPTLLQGRYSWGPRGAYFTHPGPFIRGQQRKEHEARNSGPSRESRTPGSPVSPFPFR